MSRPMKTATCRATVSTFTWQNGLGSRGKGWLLINREDTALTGSFGYGVATEGLGEWSFERTNAI